MAAARLMRAIQELISLAVLQVHRPWVPRALESELSPVPTRHLLFSQQLRTQNPEAGREVDLCQWACSPSKEENQER